jgi:signal transduction histidine kinase
VKLPQLVQPARWPVRVRLTVLYAGTFLAAGVLLIAATYWLVARSLNHAVEHPQSLEDRHEHQQAVGGGDLEAAHEAVEAYRSEALSDLLVWSFAGLAGVLVLAVVLGWVLAGRALRPLRQITRTANRVADRSLHERIGLDGPDDEVKELADTVDAMLGRLDRSFDAQRRFVANASHELRTPLTVNRTLLEVALGDPDVSDDLRQLGPRLLTTSERSERLIGGLLTLARSEHEITNRTALDLAELTATAAEHEQPEAAERHITVTTDLQPAPVEGDPVLLERLAANLVQNAVRHSPPGVEVTVHTGRTGRTGDRAFLQVANPGPQVRQDDIDAMFEPFHRGNGRVSDDRGVGLGLSIVRSVARAHGGHITASPRADGGLSVHVELPAHDT